VYSQPPELFPTLASLALHAKVYGGVCASMGRNGIRRLPYV
jgi:hypothetical protein